MNDTLFIRYITIINNKTVVFYFVLFFIIALFFIEQIGFAIINLPGSDHTIKKTDFVYFTSQKKNHKQKVSKGDDSSTEIWSNAFNFQKSWGTTVDPRTGTLIVHFKVGSLLSNIGHGPDINLQINYNSNAFADPDKVGRGWSWNLTHFDLITNQLTTANGQIFWLHQTVKGHWNPLYHKLHDIKIDGDKNRYFTITYANGLREILSHDGYETRLEQQNGWGVNFIYHRGTHLLQSVVDDEGNRITINRHQGYLDIISHKSDGQPAIIRIENHNSKPDKMTFLLASESVSPSIHLNYKGPLLTRVIYPTGLEKTFVFNCDDAMKFPSLLLSRFHSLCVVVAEETIPGAGQPAMKTHYLYSGANINGHNYLGFNSGLTTTTGNIKDTLFDAPVDYSYRTIKDNGLFKEIQTYNKYHLLIDTKLVSDHTGKTLSETENFFCNTEISDGCSQTSFTNLPITYSLPLKTINRIWG
ncbi:MAG: hypothetical protein OXC48_07890, partial [Endozoicomonadaceae bacterium]|nr:hypothetical protein [Endozoicomonadaceae bacterium]